MRILTIIIIIFIYRVCFCQEVNENNTKLRSNECIVKIIVENSQANLGSFYNGTKNNPVPGLGGNSNSLTYYIYGLDKNEFQLNIELTDNVKHGDDYITIDEWEVMVDDEINSSSHKIFRNDKFSKSVINNKRNKEKNCDGLMKVTIYIHKISIGNNVQSGTIYLNLFFSITSLN